MAKLMCGLLAIFKTNRSPWLATVTDSSKRR
jgi:hypothetical protein